MSDSPPVPDAYTTTVRGCARCGKTHESLVFVAFDLAVHGDPLLTHWTMCPNTQEPILLAFVPDVS